MVSRSTSPSFEEYPHITGKVYDESVRYKERSLNHYATETVLSTTPVQPREEQSEQRVLIEDRPSLASIERVLKVAKPGLDGRRRVENTTEWPYRYHTQLSTTFGGAVYGGSGAMIGAHHVLTCAHNIFDFQTKQWAEEVLVYPALNKKTAPFGKVKVARVYTYSQWVENGDRKYDIALLVLNETIGNSTGWGGLLATDDQSLQQETVEVTGYPGDKGCNQMWSMDYKLSVIKPEKLHYLIDTAPGQSGSPIWVNRYGLPMIIGVHTLGSNAINKGVRISRSKFTDFIKPIMSATHKLKLAPSSEPVGYIPTAVAQPNPSLLSVAQPRSLVLSSRFKLTSVAPDSALTIPRAVVTSGLVQLNPFVQTVSDQLPTIAFGREQWIATFGDPGLVPPLPADIDQILSAPCLFCNGRRQVKDTHLLVLIPETVDGVALNINHLGQLIRRPRQGRATQFSSFPPDTYKKILDVHGNTPYGKSHWVLMTRFSVEGTRVEGTQWTFAHQEALIRSQGCGLYQVPTFIEAATCILTEHAVSGTKLYAFDDTCCQEVYRGYQVTVGYFKSGLGVSYDDPFHRNHGVGLAALRKF